MANARRRRRRKPSEPDAIREAKRAKVTAQSDAKLRADGIDPVAARWGEEALDDSSREALERQGFQVVRCDDIEALDAERRGRASVVLDHRGRIMRAKKMDAFDSIDLSSEELAAVRGFQDLLVQRAGLGGGGLSEKVDGSSESTRDKLDRMIEAGRKVEAFITLIGPPSAQVLEALLDPNSDFRMLSWPDVVARLTGETTEAGQAATLRMAARGLVSVHGRVDDEVERRIRVRAQRARFEEKYGADLGGMVRA